MPSGNPGDLGPLREVLLAGGAKLMVFLSTAAQARPGGRELAPVFTSFQTGKLRQKGESMGLWPLGLWNLGMGLCVLVVTVQSPTPGPWHSLGPLTVTLSSPLPAPLVNTLKSATSFTRTPLGCRPRPVARQPLGLQAGERKRQKHCVLKALDRAELPHTGQLPDPSQALGMASCNPAPCLLCPSQNWDCWEQCLALGRELAAGPGQRLSSEPLEAKTRQIQ